jgi:hypothetical protein
MKETIEIAGGQKVQGEYVDLTEKVTVYATEKAPYHKAGDEIVAHPKTAERFIKAGYATEKKGGK